MNLRAAATIAWVACASAAHAATPDGAATYAKWCAPCHAPGITHPGTHALQSKYPADQFPARKTGVLVEWTDLTPDYVKAIVRTGVSVMPFFRKTEISDAELDALARYITTH
jgi:mono/diheme cytochrome c family protein